MENYLIIKTIHSHIAMLSVGIFTFRGLMLLFNVNHYQHRLFRLITPLIDTILLILGIALASFIGSSILQVPWFITKLILLLLYIVSGILALNRLKKRSQQTMALVVAWSCVAGIFYLAINKPMLL